MLTIVVGMVSAQELAPNRHRLISFGDVYDIEEVHLYPDLREVQVQAEHRVFVYAYDQSIDVLIDEETCEEEDGYASNTTDSTSVDNDGITGQLELFASA